MQRNELLARIDSLERRATLPQQKPQILRVAEFVIDGVEHKVMRHGEEIKLTPTELKLAMYLFQTMDKLRTRSDLLANVWGRNAEISTRTVDIHISRLRKKLDLIPENGWLLESVSGVGYRLVKLK